MKVRLIVKHGIVYERRFFFMRKTVGKADGPIMVLSPDYHKKLLESRAVVTLEYQYVAATQPYRRHF